MTTTLTLANAINVTRDLEQRLVGLVLPNQPRPRVAYACYSIAREHHAASLLLLAREQPSYATAFALLRPTLEASLRGDWIAACASEEDVKTFALGGKKQLDISSLVKALQLKSNATDMHDVIYKNLWSVVSAYTHTYEHQVQHWLAFEPPIPNYSPEQIGWLLNASTACLAVCVSSTVRLARAT